MGTPKLSPPRPDPSARWTISGPNLLIRAFFCVGVYPRGSVAQYALNPYALDPDHATRPYDAAKLIAGALGFWHQPRLGAPTRQALQTFANRALGDAAGTDWKKQAYPPMVVNGLRQLIAVSPELQAA